MTITPRLPAPIPLVVPLPYLALPVFLALGGSARGQAPPADPFAPGVRWSVGPSAAAPWLPRDVAFAAGGELVWAAPALEHAHLALFASSATAAAGAPLFAGPVLAGAIGVIPVAAGDAAHLYAAPQFPAPDASHRRTEVVRYDALAASAGAPFAPVWTRVPAVEANGPALLAGDAHAVVAALHDPAAGAVHLEWIDPETGAPATVVELPVGGAGALGALVMAAGGARVALTAGQDLWVVGADGATAHHETLASATSCLALSADGGTLVVGGFGAARVLVEGPGGAFADVAPIQGGATDIAARAAVAGDGASVAVGFWNYAYGSDVRVVWRETSGALNADVEWTGAGVLQNYPQELALTPDGARLAVALWGQGGAEPEIALFARGQAAPEFAWSLTGSPMALALSADGTRIAVAQKGAHANQFATTGAVVLLDTGERDLQLTAAARPGGVLDLAFLHPGTEQAVFGIGHPGAPAPLPGIAGMLRLDAGAPILVFPALADAAGRVELALPLPGGTALVGLSFACQALALPPSAGPGPVFSEALVLPAVL